MVPPSKSVAQLVQIGDNLHEYPLPSISEKSFLSSKISMPYPSKTLSSASIVFFVCWSCVNVFQSRGLDTASERARLCEAVQFTWFYIQAHDAIRHILLQCLGGSIHIMLHIMQSKHQNVHHKYIHLFTYKEITFTQFFSMSVPLISLAPLAVGETPTDKIFSICIYRGCGAYHSRRVHLHMIRLIKMTI